MSGGSFDYLYSRIDGENPLDARTLDLLEKMGAWLAEPEQDRAAASAELMRVHSELTEIKERISNLTRNRPFLDLVRMAEWWCSNDAREDDFARTWAEYEAHMRAAGGAPESVAEQ
jgi:hypothetical protein